MYDLIVLTDASREAYGAVVYIRSTSEHTVNFLTAKNRLIGSTLLGKTIPALETLAVTFGVETVLDMYDNLAGETVVNPIVINKILLYTDSTVALNWMQSYSISFKKLTNLTTFVINRLKKIDDLCQKHPIIFSHTSGEENTADYLTRPCSSKTLTKSKFFTGPSFLHDEESHTGDFEFALPYAECRAVDEVCDAPPPPDHDTPRKNDEQVEVHTTQISTKQHAREVEKLIPTEKYSSFSFRVGVLRNVLMFVDKLRRSVMKRTQQSNALAPEKNWHLESSNMIIAAEQRRQFSDIYRYLESNSRTDKDIPDLMNTLNIYRDESDVLRVKSKFRNKTNHPILLPKESILTVQIVRETHSSLGHGGIYSVLRELRKTFWITQYFSVVKRVLKDCIVCKRVNAIPIKINQNSYREFRTNPAKTPFSEVFLDYLGPYVVKVEGVRKKVWLLAVTCLWSRAVNILICRDATVAEFIRAIQLHIYKFGIFQTCISDLGSSIQAGANLITSFLSDHETHRFFESRGMKQTTFQHFPKGNSSLGSVIESMVKQIKKLLYKSIRNIILDYFGFEMIIAKVIMLVNKRPVAFKEGLRALSLDETPEAITPEMLILGYDTPVINVIPGLQASEDIEESSITDEYSRIRKVKDNLIDQYQGEFMATLIKQAVDKKGRYKPVFHSIVSPGDVVLLVDKMQKQYNYPLGTVLSVEKNDLDEVTSAYVRKGSTGETVYRHVTSLIPLLSDESDIRNREPELDREDSKISEDPAPKPKRKAAQNCSKRISSLAERALI